VTPKLQKKERSSLIPRLRNRAIYRKRVVLGRTKKRRY